MNTKLKPAILPKYS